ncbi:MAG: type II toxin-antitoxin system VapC family toxin [Microcoleus sp. PH2017_10_PVI_O_A]|uniref:type II toxin-antitoxin system VapC family toxin n=1 Tax=unclassified Microcoleus TaxID=2642155 RepID=UPI001D62BC69|nr:MULTISPECIES: type II toxin-antitoxin system VapC family toxin [unclassified Microcoleus]TAE81798.1 MAG: type II toxin-antitoxin system VapC family toxin [Oscillatoriales cyanobacterium]MCC3406923.1 type II toxin-antitoxin system VapC family toxin [Microcoleus sp. PH2017_10_PVI_O_A]MCC3461019.1 type II toxin-antitoxin system VapC family toxin [Microcoleus sp. PH2017_11_PCY_U_A]MCC3479578.1 type II toxin-antitoxin system VapC family toxin [Microcoleus sp. PH2017_12_PCY_D_A]MCC3526777.1 type 
MSLWVLDTDHLSLLQRGYPQIRQRINAVNPEEIAITMVTVVEQLSGRLNQIKSANSENTLTFAYRQLRETLEDFRNINLLDFDRDAYNCYTDLVRQKIRVGTQDLRIAAIVISRNAVLVTRNRRDFERVPRLRFEDWTVDVSDEG